MQNTNELMEVDLDSETFTDFGFYDVSKNNINASPVTYGPYDKAILSDWKQCKLHCKVMQAFDKMNIKEMTSIQKHCVSYLMNELNVAVIGASKGKSISYLGLIVSSMMSNINKIKKSVSAHIGPHVIIFTNSLEMCFELENLLKTLLSVQTEEINVLVLDPFVSVPVLEVSLIHSSNILISTPSGLDLLLDKMNYFSWLNLKYFVFENLDVLLDDYGIELATVLKMLLDTRNDFNEIQFISTSVKWSEDMDEFLKDYFYEWQYIFGCHLEAARYLNIQFCVVHLKKNKLKMISWYLENNFKDGRMVLISSNTDELSLIQNYIQEFNPDIDVLLANPSKSDLTLKKWNNPLEKNQRLMICSDDMMFDHYIDNTDYLIHYDIPTKEFKFEERFSFLKDSNNKPKKNVSSSYVFLSETAEDISMMPKVIETMKYFDDVDTILEQVAKKEINIQEKKKKTLLCDKLLQFGECPGHLSCKNRHIAIKELDKPAENIPMSGLAEIQILNVYDASHMSAKLLKLNNTNSLTDTENWLKVEDNSDIIKRELSLFYSNPESRINLENLKPGDKVAVKLEYNTKKVINSEYFRAIVIDIIDKNIINSKVRVQLVDKGLVVIVSKQIVFSLPHHLEKLQTTTVDVFLLSVKPTYFNKIWYPKADLYVKEKIVSMNSVTVDVQFSFGNTMCISKMYSKQFSQSLNKFENETILPNMLFECNYGITNSLHYNNLKGLILSAGIDLLPSLEGKKIEDNYEPNIEITVSNVNNLIKWAYLDKTLTRVDIEFFTSPECFFVRNANTSDELCSLHLLINDYISKSGVEPFKNIIEGAIGLAFHKGTKQFCRVKIFKIKDVFTDVFYVDYGEFGRVKINSLLTILPILISLLPFQAIECSLYRIKKVVPLEDLVNSKIRLHQEALQIKVVQVKSPAIFTDGCHYKVIVLDNNSNINSLLREIYHKHINVHSDELSNTTDSS